MVYHEIKTETWKEHAENDSIEGILLHKEEKTTDLGAKYYFETPKREKKLVWGSTILDDRMKLTKIGERIRITYKGLIANKDPEKNDIKNFKVESWSDD